MTVAEQREVARDALFKQFKLGPYAEKQTEKPACEKNIEAPARKMLVPKSPRKKNH